MENKIVLIDKEWLVRGVGCRWCVLEREFRDEVGFLILNYCKKSVFF